MKYVYTKGPWKEYYGYIFYDGKPTEVSDPATLGRIQREADFQLHEEPNHGEEERQVRQETPVLKGKECTKCHKLIPQGWYMHQKWCKG